MAMHITSIHPSCCNTVAGCFCCSCSCRRSQGNMSTDHGKLARLPSVSRGWRRLNPILCSSSQPLTVQEGYGTVVCETARPEYLNLPKVKPGGELYAISNDSTPLHLFITTNSFFPRRNAIVRNFVNVPLLGKVASQHGARQLFPQQDREYEA